MSELHTEWPGSAVAEGTTERAPAKDEVGVGARSFSAEKLGVWWAVGVPLGFYLVSAALLLFGLDSHPGFTYNWENNTANGLFAFVDQPTLGIFHLTEGLMTDSGSS